MEKVPFFLYFRHESFPSTAAMTGVCQGLCQGRSATRTPAYKETKARFWYGPERLGCGLVGEGPGLVRLDRIHQTQRPPARTHTHTHTHTHKAPMLCVVVFPSSDDPLVDNPLRTESRARGEGYTSHPSSWSRARTLQTLYRRGPPLARGRESSSKPDRRQSRATAGSLFPSENKIFYCSAQIDCRRPEAERHPCTMNELLPTWIHAWLPSRQPRPRSRMPVCWSLVRAFADQATQQPDSASRDCRCGSRASCGLSGATGRRDGGILGGLSQCIDASGYLCAAAACRRHSCGGFQANANWAHKYVPRCRSDLSSHPRQLLAF